jgi:peroxiredoxin
LKVSSILLTALLAAILALGPGEVSDLTPSHSGHDAGTRSLRPIPPEPPASEVETGDPAPDFAYQAEDNRWRRLRDLLAQGPVLLVFGADPTVLAAIERERDAMLRLGVVPVALLDVRSGRAWATARRLGLRYPVLPDTRRVIAAQFRAVDPAGQSTVPSWFVVDRSRRVRGLRRGDLPKHGYASLAAMVLGLPDPGADVPAEKR